MQLTEDFIKKNFIVFNNEYFDGKLKMPKFRVMHTKSRLGLCSWKNTSGVKTDYTISVTDYFVFGEKKLQNIILHEMIHLYIRQNGIKDSRTHHGRVFYSIADKINRHGWNIARTDSVNGYETKEKKTYHLIAFKDSKDKYFLMAYNPKYESYYVSYFAKYPYHFKNPVWFTSDDSKAYGSLSECHRGVRGRFISKEKYNALQGKYALPLAI
jgi:hypothetical protein